MGSSKVSATHGDNFRTISSSDETLNSDDPSPNAIGERPFIPKYNRLVAPTHTKNSMIFVVVRLKIREVVDVDAVQETVTVDGELEVSWIDWEIRKNYLAISNATRDELERDDADILSKIWKPDIYIDELAGIERHTLIAKPIRVFIITREKEAGTVTFQARQALKLHCNMEFHYYPADTQMCNFTIRSLSYPTRILRVLWADEKSVFLDETENSNFDFQIADVEPGEKLKNLVLHYQVTPEHTAKYSALSFTLRIRRNVMFHLIQTYLPSVLLVLITWLCFLLPTDMVEARIGVSMTTLLTLTAMFTAVREHSPEVSYIKAIDVWMVFCMFLIFLALVLFTAIHWSLRKLLNKTESQPSVNGTVKRLRQGRRGTHSTVTRYSTSYAFPLFVMLFLSFVAVYAICLMYLSEYWDWSPSSKYNAVDQNSTVSQKMYSRLETNVEADEENRFSINNITYNEALSQAFSLENATEEVEEHDTISLHQFSNLKSQN